MIEFFRQHLEQEKISEMRELISQVHKNRYISIIHYIFFVAIGILSFVLLIITQWLADIYPEFCLSIWITGIFIVGLIIISTQILKRHPVILDKFLKIQIKIKNWLLLKRYLDLYFTYHNWIFLILYFPLILGLYFILFKMNKLILLKSDINATEIDSIKLIISFSGVIIASQIALFTFMSGQLLGKYSSQIVIAINKHKVIISLFIYPIISIFVLSFLLKYGYPDIFEGLYIPIIFIQNLFCLLMTIIVSTKGIHADKAIIYAGYKLSKKAIKDFKPAILSVEKKISYLWNLLGMAGLDWRDPERKMLLEPPHKTVFNVKEYLKGFFNAANKAILENQGEIFSASLISIGQIIYNYITVRKSYHGSKDEVLTYANDQFSSLIKSTSKASNEYMITELVQFIGNIGKLTFLISEYPEIKQIEEKSKDIPKEHAHSTAWINLLTESFEYSHILMRSTAASEVIIQLRFMAIEALRRDYYSVITISCLDAIEKLHQICMLKPDSYHLFLAGNCIQSNMTILYFASQNTNKFGGYHHVFNQVIESIQNLIINQFKIPNASDNSSFGSIFF